MAISGPTRQDARNRWFAIYTVMLLSIVNLFNFMDRLVLAVLLPDIQNDLALTDTQLGLLTGFAFAIFYALFGIPLARLADAWSRKGVLAISLVLWSLMTALTGAATSFALLFLARVGVGVGEAGGIPPSHALISAHVSPARRATALAVHTMGAALGMVAGLALGGLLSEHYGWRITFALLGLPGIFLAILVYATLRDHAASVPRDTPARAGPDLARSLRTLFASPTYVHLVLALSVGAFMVNGVNQWLPTYYARAFGLSSAQIGLFYGLALGLGYALGALIGGVLADKWRSRDLRVPLWVGIAALILALPAWLGVFHADSPSVALSLNFAAALLSNIVAAPLIALIQAVAPERMRAMASAIYIFCASVVGVGAGPFLVGFISDQVSMASNAESLRFALSVILLCTAAPVFNLWRASRFAIRDIQEANRQEEYHGK